LERSWPLKVRAEAFQGLGGQNVLLLGQQDPHQHEQLTST